LSPTDEELVTAARAGDRAALESLLRAHHDTLYGVCVRVTGNPADGADACQNALLAIATRLADFGGRARFSTWAYRIAVNASLDELRRQRRRPEPRAPAEDVPDPGVGDAEQVALRLDVAAALATLSPEQRAPVVLRDLGGLAYDEIAEVLDLAPGTVRSRIARGRAALAAALDVGPAGADDDELRRGVPGELPGEAAADGTGGAGVGNRRGGGRRPSDARP